MAALIAILAASPAPAPPDDLVALAATLNEAGEEVVGPVVGRSPVQDIREALAKLAPAPRTCGEMPAIEVGDMLCFPEVAEVECRRRDGSWKCRGGSVVYPPNVISIERNGQIIWRRP